MKRIIVGIGIVLFLGFVIAILFSKRERSGIEFCPQTFEQRSFVYYVNAFGSYNMDRDVPIPCDQAIASKLNPLTSYGMRKR